MVVIGTNRGMGQDRTVLAAQELPKASSEVPFPMFQFFSPHKNIDALDVVP